MKSMQPADRECKVEAHARVHAAASDGGWTFCPICEVAHVTALWLEAVQVLKMTVTKFDKLTRMLLKRTDLEEKDVLKTEKWLDEVRATLAMNPGSPREPLARKTLGSPRSRGSSRSKGGRT